MAARREITKKYAQEYQRVTKTDKGRLLASIFHRWPVEPLDKAGVSVGV
ncbi:MAG: hypothetical protein WA880_04670 [Ornithinimicrobium sp.]